MTGNINNMDIFFRIASEINSTQDMDQLLKYVLNEVLDVFDIHRGMIMLLDSAGEHLLLKAHRGIPANLLGVLQKSRINDAPLAARVFSTGEALVKSNINEIDILYKALIKPEEPFFFVYCPIKTSQNVLGLMMLQGPGFKDFTANSKMILLEAICNTLGEAITRSRKESESIYLARELELLQNINAALNSTAGLTEVLDTITEGMIKVFGYTGSMIFLNATGDGVKITLGSFAYDYTPGIIRKIEDLLGFSLKGHVFEPEQGDTINRLFHEQLPYISNKISDQIGLLFHKNIMKKLAPVVANLLPVRSALSIPLIMGEKVKGILIVASRQELDEDDLTRVKAFAAQAAQAIETAQLFENEQRHAAELSALQTVSKSISSTLNLTEILRNATRQMVELMHVDHCGILTFDEDRERGNVLADYPESGATSESFPLKGYGAAERIIAVPKPLVIEDTRHDPLMASVQDTMLRLDIRSMLILPLIIKGKTVGSIGLDSIGKQRIFQPDEITLAQTITDQISVAIENARLFENEHRQKQVNETLLETNRIISSTLELEDVLKRILKQLKKVINYQAASIWMVNEERNELYIKVTDGFGGDTEKFHLRLDGEKGVTVYTARAGILQYVPDTAKEKRYVSRGINGGSELAVPLKIKGKVIGVLNLESKETDAYCKEDLQLISTFASQTSITIDNARLFEAERSRRHFAETLGKIARVVISTLDLDSRMHLILKELRKILLFDTVSILIFSGEELVLAATLGYEDEELVSEELHRHLKDSPLLREIVRTHRSIKISDVRKEKKWIWVPGAEQVRSWIGMPLIVRNRVVGILSVDKFQPGFFSKKDVEIVQTFTDQTAAALDNARLYEEVKKSEERFRYVMANTGDWVWEIDAEGRYTYSSPVVEQLLGYTTQELLGKHFFDFFCQEKREKLKITAFKKFQKGGPFTSFINFNLHKDGYMVILETSGTPIFGPDGQVSGYRGSYHDITARVKAEEALAISERKYRTLVQHANDWIWTLDRKGIFTFINQEAEKAIGYKSENWLGKSFVPLILQDDLPRVQQAFADTLAGKTQTYEIHVHTRDGKVLTLSVNTAPIYEGETITGTVSMGRDVSTQRQLEEQLREAQKMEALGTLAGGIAHDFNNILGGILGYTTFIKSELPQGSSMHREINSMISLVHRAAGLTRQLLGFARGGSYHIEPININHIIDEVLRLLSRTIDKAISIEPVLSPDLAAIEGDAGQIQQMILNLCLNARDAMPKGGRLFIETKNVAIDDSSGSIFPEMETGVYVKVSVSDTGSGMDPETKARIFDPFFSTKGGQGSEKHSGLGLSMVYGIVKNHSGYIDVESEVGSGTTFKAYFPSTKREIAEAGRKLVTPIRGEETLLLVDDDETILKISKRSLSKAGYKVLIANGGKEALNIFGERHKEIVLVILDMIMPNTSGREVYKHLKKTDPEVRVLLSSGYSKDGQAQELLDSGVQGFLQKPYEFSEFLQTIRQILDED
jgi:PAS domain S-box-containing protein